ncbi:MAG: hypothetical protein WCP35_11660 [Verrucomicrobiota bacterium]
MLLLLQLALGIAFLGFLVLAFFDAVRGTLIILSGLGLLVIGLTLKGVAFILKQFQPAPVPAVAATPRVRTWKVVAH